MSTNHNPFETPRPAGTSLVQGVLRVVVAVQCFGLAAGRLHRGRRTPLADMLIAGEQWTPVQISQFENWAAIAMAVIGVSVLFQPITLALMAAVCVQAGIAVATVVMEQGSHPLFGGISHAVRIIAPLSLLLVDFWPPRIRPTLILCLSSMAFLRIAAVVTFTAQGIICLMQFREGGSLVEVITLCVENLTRREFDAKRAQLILGVAGAFQIAMAFSLLNSRTRAVAFWMATWGLLSAASRFVAYGIHGYDLAMIRIAEGGVPLALMIFWMWAYREQKPLIVPDPRDRRDDGE